MNFETVHTVTDWRDGPRRGVADFRGRPHLFESQWGDGEDLDEDSFLLTPVDAATLALALEDWAIWRRWETAFERGETTTETHPALPEDRARHEELERLLNDRLTTEPARAVRARAEFRARHDPNWSGHGWRPLAACWTELPDD